MYRVKVSPEQLWKQLYLKMLFQGLICVQSRLCFTAVMKCGMSCSLFEVVDGKGKPTSGSLAALVNKLERDRMVS